MCRLCRTNTKFDKEISRSVKRLIHNLKKENNISKAVLFGSYARGDINENSDVDLLIVGDFTESFFARTGKVLALYKGKKDIEPFVYTDKEFDNMKKEKRSFLEEILKTGIKLL